MIRSLLSGSQVQTHHRYLVPVSSSIKVKLRPICLFCVLVAVIMEHMYYQTGKYFVFLSEKGKLLTREEI